MLKEIEIVKFRHKTHSLTRVNLILINFQDFILIWEDKSTIDKGIFLKINYKSLELSSWLFYEKS